MQPTDDMYTSPHDRSAVQPAPANLTQLRRAPAERWAPSHYNARTVEQGGKVMLWNTLTGAISVFQPRDQEAVLSLLSPDGVAEPLDQLGRYLAKRGFLVRRSVDEFQRFRLLYAREQWRSDILQLHILASEDCNFRCIYCYEKFKHGTMLPEVREGIRNLVLKRASELQRLEISWFGGEPLYGWEAVEELSPFFQQTAQKFGIVQQQGMTTNGYLLTEERATRLLEWGCLSFQITIDGLPEEHDCKRVGRDGSATYSVILDNLRSLRDRQDTFSVAVRVNFDRDNVPRLGAFLEALREDFAGDARFRLRFRPVGRWGGERDNDLNTCGLTERRTAQRSLEKKAEAENLEVEGGILMHSQPGSQVCYAARPYNFIVGATGKLMKCTIALDEREENIVGRLLPDGTMELDDDRLAHWVNPHYESDSLCPSCHLLPTCQGAACPLVRLDTGKRSCCATKSSLKHDMRFTLAKHMLATPKRSAP